MMSSQESKKILFLDMDCVLADFCNSPAFERHEQIKHSPPRMFEENFFGNLPTVKGATWGVASLIKSNMYDIHILSKPVSTTHYSYSEKAGWVWKYFPLLGHRIHLTQNKEFFAGKGRVLVDDTAGEWKEKWEEGGGEFIHFNYSDFNHQHNRSEWERIVEELTKE